MNYKQNLLTIINLKARKSDIYKFIASPYVMNNSMLKRINQNGAIFQVFGLPRSGTSILCNCLDSHPKTICLSEPFLSWLCTGQYKLSTGTKSLLKNEDTTSNALPITLFKSILKDNNNIIIGFKETFRELGHNSFPNESFIKKNCRENCVSKSIAIIRDPRDIWASRISRFKNCREPLNHKFLGVWNSFSSWILEESIFHVTYENLVSDTQAALDLICSELDVQFSSDMLTPPPNEGYGDTKAEAGGNLFTSSVSSYQHKLAPDEIKTIEEKCGVFMQKFGYLSN